MPEGPEVTIYARRLNDLLSGKHLKNIAIIGNSFENKKYDKFRYRLDSLQKTLRNLQNDEYIQIDWIRNKGKYIYGQLSIHSPTKHGVKFFGNHFNLTGNWRTKLTKHSRIVIECENTEKVYFDDYQKLGEFSILNISEIREKLSLLGPDVLGVNFTKDLFLKIMKKYAKSKRSIATILLDQSIVSGIGNYLRADILYVAKINPVTPVCNLIESDLIDLYNAITSIVRESYDRGATAIKVYGDGFIVNPGNYDPIIYEKQEAPDGNKVKHFKLSERTMYWVPSTQLI